MRHGDGGGDGGAARSPRGQDGELAGGDRARRRICARQTGDEGNVGGRPRVHEVDGPRGEPGRLRGRARRGDTDGARARHAARGKGVDHGDRMARHDDAMAANHHDDRDHRVGGRGSGSVAGAVLGERDPQLRDRVDRLGHRRADRVVLGVASAAQAVARLAT